MGVANQAPLDQDTKKRKINWRRLKINWQLYLLLAPGLIYFIVFKYYPMYGLQIAFKNFRAVDGILGSEWVGLDHFKRLDRKSTRLNSSHVAISYAVFCLK